MSATSDLTERPAGTTIGRELLFEQIPIITLVLILGFASAYAQHGFLPGHDVAFPLAGVRVPIWHLIWMGFWTGYTMAVVGQAAGIFALTYQMSVLQFANSHVTPTTMLITFLNPIGALSGFRRAKQWNIDLAVWVCLGGAIGGLIGPYIRITLLSDVKPFTLAVGLVLAFAGAHLCYAAWQGFWSRRTGQGLDAKFHQQAMRSKASGRSPSGLPSDLSIRTTHRSGIKLTIEFWDESWTVNQVFLFLTGAGVGTVSAALGLGGGFLLVPIFAAVYGLPIYVLVAATIPFVIVLSAVGLFTFGVILPASGHMAIQPEWSWGLFAAAGGIAGSWFAAKTQRYVPQHALKFMLGGITLLVGSLYILGYFIELPFRF